MRKVLLKSVMAALVGVGLMAGQAAALTLDHGVELMLIDGDSDDGVSVTVMNTDVDDGYDLMYSVEQGVWNDVADPVGFATYDGGTIMDFALVANGDYFSLSGDYDDGSYQVTMDFSGPLDPSGSYQPEVENPYYSNVTISWALPNINTTSLTFAFSSGNDGVAPAPVPEPATMLLFGTGLAGLAGVSRRRKK